jgi:hypothetical protein
MAAPDYYDVAGTLQDGEAWVAVGSTIASSDPTSITITSTDDGQTGDFSQYMDLVVILYGQSRYTGGSGCTARLHVNGVETGDKYPTQYFRSDGSNATAVVDTGSDWFDCAEWPSDTDSTDMFGCAVVHLLDINSGKHKSMVSTWAGDRNGSGLTGVHAAVYLSQAPITSVTFRVRRGGSGLNIATGSRIDLFGILPRMVF